MFLSQMTVSSCRRTILLTFRPTVSSSWQVGSVGQSLAFSSTPPSCSRADETLSTASPNLQAVVFLWQELWASSKSCTGKPLHPTSTGNSQACHPFSLHCWTWYLMAVLCEASSHPSSHGTVSSIMEFLYIITFWHFATLNSLTTVTAQTWCIALLMWSLKLVKLKPPAPSTDVKGSIVGSRPCWKSQALNFPGKPFPSVFVSHLSASDSFRW